jgi:WS/DGAT/MGAT family acyltransferase
MADPRSHQRLSALEAAFLGLESHDVPFVHAAILSFDRPIALEPLRAHVAAALADVPRYRQHMVPRSWGAADWIADPDDRIEDHVQAATVAVPGGTRELEDLAARLLAFELPAERSPWRVWTVDGLAGDQGAIISVFHHALVDGIAGFRLLAYVLRGPVSVTEAEPAAPPAASPGKLSVLRRLAAWPNVTALVRQLRDGVRPASQIGLNPSRTGRVRAVASLAVDLASVKDIARAFDATTNDVVLATVSGGLRRFLARRDLAPDELRDVRAMIPVGRHGKTARETAGNRVVMLLAALPVDEADPTVCLRRITAATRRLKAGHSAGGGELLVALSEATTPALLTGILRLALRMRGFNVIVTNVPGPTEELGLLGARLTRIAPIVNLWPHQALGIAVASYAGALVFGLQTDRRVVPDVDRLRDDLAVAFDALRDAAARKPPAVPLVPPEAASVRSMHPLAP